MPQTYHILSFMQQRPPEPKLHGYPAEVRQQAMQYYVDGMNLHRIARHLGFHHRTVSLWVKASAASLPEVPVPK
jgi:transposase-like protein